ncbi:GntR family transcriptional regulator [Pseudolysinimonas sp.]|jgi:DNA-binding GntR family transcriptional regulator|uniref:GntR family transcriptional regulator n=1 Tax=Pseudolysinimonas sp. TaxID=2680009 RepID=UPI003784331C
MSLQPATMPDAIFETLRARILDQSQAPGSTVTESAVALRFGVARPTAKIAIERLVSDGLLRREAHHAARVPELTRADIVDLFATRRLIESAASGALAEGGTLPADALAAHRELLELARTGGAFAAQDAAFHRALVSGSPSPRLARMHAALMGEIELCIGQVQAHHLMTGTDVAAQHQRILDAVTAGDGAAAADLARAHIDAAGAALLAHYDATHGDIHG